VRRLIVICTSPPFAGPHIVLGMRPSKPLLQRAAGKRLLVPMINHKQLSKLSLYFKERYIRPQSPKQDIHANHTILLFPNPPCINHDSSQVPDEERHTLLYKTPL
jgi:hypothetical protein